MGNHKKNRKKRVCYFSLCRYGGSQGTGEPHAFIYPSGTLDSRRNRKETLLFECFFIPRSMCGHFSRVYFEESARAFAPWCNEVSLRGTNFELLHFGTETTFRCVKRYEQPHLRKIFELSNETLYACFLNYRGRHQEKKTSEGFFTGFQGPGVKSLETCKERRNFETLFSDRFFPSGEPLPTELPNSRADRAFSQHTREKPCGEGLLGLRCASLVEI